MPQVSIPDHEHKELLGFKERFLKMMKGGYYTINDPGHSHSVGESLEAKKLQSEVDQLRVAVSEYEKTLTEKSTARAQISGSL